MIRNDVRPAIQQSLFLLSPYIPPPTIFVHSLPVPLPRSPSQGSKFKTPVHLHRIHHKRYAGRREHQTKSLKLDSRPCFFPQGQIASHQSPITSYILVEQTGSAIRTETTPRATLQTQHPHTRQLEHHDDLTFPLLCHKLDVPKEAMRASAHKTKFWNAVLLQ
jgi:hypothetical protein